MKKITLTSVIYFFFTVFSYSQVNIEGVIFDNNLNPVSNASVLVLETKIGAHTDLEGIFFIENELSFPITLQVSCVGFQTIKKHITKASEKIEITLPFLNFLDEVVISPSRTSQKTKESSVTIERLSINNIKHTSSIDYYNSLENIKGVDINTGSLTFKSVNTRGFATFANRRFIQLIDGMDNAPPSFNFTFGNGFGIMELDVQSVELLPGTSSALYGANAFNGALFITSKSPFEHPGVSAYAKSGITSSNNAGDHVFIDAGFRAAHTFSDVFSAKTSFSFMKGTDWYATDYTDVNNAALTRIDPSYDGLNVYGDEVATILNFDAIANVSEGTYGSAVVSRTGYNEQELVDNDAKNIHADAAFHFKPWKNDFEIVFNSRFSVVNSMFHSSNRTTIRDFIFSQHKLELRNNNFYFRGYFAAEDAGNSYDTKFAAININKLWSPDKQWFADYGSGYIQAIKGEILGVPAQIPNDAHQYARSFADADRLIPGSTEFINAFNKITDDPNLLTGSKFVDKSKYFHFDGNYSFKDLINIFELQVGGSARYYTINSEGTIFTDINNPIKYSEFGSYLQVQKELLNNQLKLTGALRYDKSQNFDGEVSPKLSFIYFLEEVKNHSIRASFQKGFRNPSTEDQYIGLDIGNAILVGSAPENLNRFVSRPIPLSANAQALGFGSSIQFTGNDPYSNAFTFESFLNFIGSAGIGTPDPTLLNASKENLVQPEKITAFEMGYRGVINNNFIIDALWYYNKYDNFINPKLVVVPRYGNVDLLDIHPQENAPNAVLALSNSDFTLFQVYTNLDTDISAYGGALGVSTTIFKGFDFQINYTFANLDFKNSSESGFESRFNTPKHAVKASFGKQNVCKSFGFNINWRWSDKYQWESEFADAILPARSIFDAQISYHIPKWDSRIKIGGANIFNHQYVSAPGSGVVGAQYYISFIID